MMKHNTFNNILDPYRGHKQLCWKLRYAFTIILLIICYSSTYENSKRSTKISSTIPIIKITVNINVYIVKFSINLDSYSQYSNFDFPLHQIAQLLLRMKKTYVLILIRHHHLQERVKVAFKS